MSRAYGEKAQQGWRDAADIAKLIRVDIKAAIGAGELPGKPANYSVRTRKYAGGQSIDVEALDLPGMWQICRGIVPGSDKGRGGRSCGRPWCKYSGINKDLPGAEEHSILTAEGRQVEEVLQKIHDSYNWDGSEVMVDYFDRLYWGRAEIESEWSARSRAEQKAAREAKRARATA